MASASGYQQVAERYASAFFELAVERGEIDRVATDLAELSVMLGESKDLQRLVSTGALKRDVQAQAILALASSAKFSDLTQKFLGSLASQGRLAALPGVLGAMQEKISTHRGEVTAEVVSAEALDKAQTEAIAAALKKALGKSVKVETKIDPSIMGGLVVRIGSKLIDSSVKTKLERLARALKNQSSSDDTAKMREVA